MHEHPLRMQLIVYGVEDLHAEDYHVFAGYCLYYAGFLDIWVPLGISLDV